MADDRWKSCEGTWDRLKWARLQRFETAKDAAPALGEKVGTYNSYERRPGSSKHTPLTHQKAMHFAKRLGVRWEWLLLGTDEPFVEDPGLVEINDKLKEMPKDQRDEYVQAIKVLISGRRS